jgi:electron transfer flavoprotein alpha subunit
MTPSSAHDADDSSPTEAALAADVWVVSVGSNDDLLGRLGDARDVADRDSLSVAVLRFDPAGRDDEQQSQPWIQGGADAVLVLRPSSESQSAWIDAALQVWNAHSPRLILTSADRVGRAWSARLAARTGWTLVSPALLVHAKGQKLLATRLDGAGRRAAN